MNKPRVAIKIHGSVEQKKKKIIIIKRFWLRSDALKVHNCIFLNHKVIQVDAIVLRLKKKNFYWCFSHFTEENQHSFPLLFVVLWDQVLLVLVLFCFSCFLIRREFNEVARRRWRSRRSSSRFSASDSASSWLAWPAVGSGQAFLRTWMERRVADLIIHFGGAEEKRERRKLHS